LKTKEGGRAIQKVNYEVGCIHDTLAFLSFFADEIAGSDMNVDFVKINQYYVQIKQEIAQKNIVIPEYIYPFVYKRKKSISFLQAFILDSTPYSKCTYDRLMNILNTDFRSEYIRFYCPNISAADEKLLLSGDKPEVISTVKKSLAEKMLDTYFLNSIYFYERIIEILIEIISILYKHISQTHQLFFQNNDIQKALQAPLILEKLRAITNGNKNSLYTFSLSLLDADIISFKEEEPEFVLLGCDFTNRLDVEYKYCHVTPLLFAQAIGNIVKYDIIKSLAKMQPMSMTDMFKVMDYGKNELDYNLNEMRKSGIVIIDHVKRRQNFYKLDSNFIKIVADQLSQYI